MGHHEGYVIAGRYRLEREIARGGMGSVWTAYDDKLRRSVAIKLLMQSNSANSAVSRRRFEREAMAVARLSSPHVVQVFDYGVDDACPFMVMELLEGADLRRRLTVQRRLSLEEAGRILVQAAKGLSVAHAAGIVHRDLKPGNIFLVRGRDEELVKLLDFGVAKYISQQSPELDQDTKDGSILGTPQFMAPEQARGVRTVDHRADLWSLGIIAFKALTGQLPFNGQTAADLIVRLCTDDPPSALGLAPDLPPDIDKFFTKALARDPAKRFQTAREMAVAFSRIAPVSFPTMNMPEPLLALALAMNSSAGELLEFDDDETAVRIDHEEPTSLAPRSSAGYLGVAPDSSPLASLDEVEGPLSEHSTLGGSAGPRSEPRIRLAVPIDAHAPLPASALRHELPTPDGGMAGGGPSQRPPSSLAPPARDRTWLLALGAVAVGVLIAVAGNLATKHDEVAPVVRAQAAPPPASDEKSRARSAPSSDGKPAPKTAARPAVARAPAGASQPRASEPVHEEIHDSEPPAASAPPPPPPATPPPPPSASAAAPPPVSLHPTPPPAAPPTSKAKAGDPDPFSERL